MTTNEMDMYDRIVELEIANANELNLARNLVGGNWEEVLNAVVKIRTGYNTLDQYECELYEELYEEED